MNKININLATMRQFKRVNLTSIRSNTRTIEVMNELTQYYFSPTAFVDFIVKKYYASPREIAERSPAVVTAGVNGADLVQRVYDGKSVEYIPFQGPTVGQIHVLDFIVGKLSAAKYAAKTGICALEDFEKHVSSGKVGEFAPIVNNKVSTVTTGSKGVRIYLLADINRLKVFGQAREKKTSEEDDELPGITKSGYSTAEKSDKPMRFIIRD